ACASSGETLPPLGLGAMLPVACRRSIHLIAELGLTSNQSAASRREAPDTTAFTTRSRNSKEHGLGIDPPSITRINAARFNYASARGNPDSIQPKFALRHSSAVAVMVRIITPNAGLNLDLWRLAPFWLFRNFKCVVGARAFITKCFWRLGGWHIPHKAVIRGLE